MSCSILSGCWFHHISSAKFSWHLCFPDAQSFPPKVEREPSVPLLSACHTTVHCRLRRLHNRRGGEGELEPLLFPIGVKERLVDGDGVGEGYMFCIKGRNNGPLREASYPKSEERFIGKYGLWNPSSRPNRPFMLSAWMRAFTDKNCFALNSWNKYAVDISNGFLFSLDDFGKICLPHPYTTASLIVLVDG